MNKRSEDTNNKSDTKSLKCIIFSLTNEIYATELLSVIEVIEHQEIKAVPYAPKYFLGITNLRGKVISVIDLRKKFKMELDKEDRVEDKFIMVLDMAQRSIGVLVDKVLSVQDLKIDEIAYTPVSNANVNQKYLIGATRLNKKLVTIIKLSELINEEEILKANSSNTQNTGDYHVKTQQT